MLNENKNVQTVLLLALFCILESISFTRKDGQYLRWDQHSGRCLGALPFNKGEIRNFNDAMTEKLEEIISDVKGESEKDLLGLNTAWVSPLSIYNNHELLQKILEYLYSKKENKTLNNNGIPRMVKGYFYEMACVIYELYRVLSPGGEVVMVNDNVRYARASISADLILSDIAAKIGFHIEEISVLPIGKGNSSQQMGMHGREALRKCVYIWRKK